MTVVYRLVREGFAEGAFSGEGARLRGGRWNPRGYPVIYASESRALAALEALVHVSVEARRMRFLIYEVTLPQNAGVLHFAGNIVEWRRPEAVTSTQRAGRAWIDEGKALAFAVPSVIVPEETNYVLNVRHPGFPHLRISRPKPFAFDERL